MPITKIISARTSVQATQEDVFKTVTDWESQSKWIFATKVKGVGSDSHRLGGELEAFTGIGSVGFLDTMTITKWEPPRTCEVTHTGSIVRGSGLFEVSTENGTTYFTWTEYTQLPFGIIGRAGWLVIGPITNLGLKLSLRRFRKLF